MNIKEKVQKIWEKHKTKIVAGIAISGAILTVLYRKGSDEPALELEGHSDESWRLKRQEIDEDIFTNLAMSMEDAIFDDSMDEAYFEETYTVPMPKGGDFNNGTYDVLKNVQVIVRDAGMPQ